MDKSTLYTSGQFAKKAHISVRTIRYYDQQDILKPAYISNTGARFYSEADFTRLQQILLLKYLGFSLEEIKKLTIGDSDYHVLLTSLKLQQKLIKDRIAQMQLVDQAITSTTKAIQKNKSIDWNNMLNLIHLTNMENSLETQYQNASNISARISLHTLYSTNTEGWFPWVFRQLCTAASTYLNAAFDEHCMSFAKRLEVLELGCGDGSLWVQNYNLIPGSLNITLSDISGGMLRDAKRSIDRQKVLHKKSAYDKAISSDSEFKIKYKAFDCASIPYKDNSFDIIIANHVLFYCDSLNCVLQQIRRVLKPGGIFVCSSYSSNHMKEINLLVKKFDERIVLSKNKLYEKFGLENGASILEPYFSSIELKNYEDSLQINKPEPLIDYILSCHGNQNQYLLNRYTDFKNFLSSQLKQEGRALTITKDAGLFICR
ncbi:MAG: MerR family transcriptional regulator [Eubacteriales bacterium]|nr:MerR family transcriptional regulator [Eubacteriales bacterium]